MRMSLPLLLALPVALGGLVRAVGNACSPPRRSYRGRHAERRGADEPARHARGDIAPLAIYPHLYGGPPAGMTRRSRRRPPARWRAAKKVKVAPVPPASARGRFRALAAEAIDMECVDAARMK